MVSDEVLDRVDVLPQTLERSSEAFRREAVALAEEGYVVWSVMPGASMTFVDDARVKVVHPPRVGDPVLVGRRGPPKDGQSGEL